MNISRPPSKQPIPPHAKRVFQGVIFDVHQWQQQMYDGSYATFEGLKRPDTVSVIPITNQGKIILSEQEQPGETPFIGAIGGRVDPGEDPHTCAVRELEEEAGFKNPQLTFWFAIQLAPKIDFAAYTFFARNWEDSGQTKLDAGEKIKLIEISFEEFINQIVVSDRYRDFEIAFEVLKTKQDSQKMVELRQLFLGK